MHMKYPFIFLILCISHLASGQQVSCVTYDYEQGLIGSQITAIYEDDRGILWVSTPGVGIFQFDGRRFEFNFPIDADETIHQIARTPGGRIYFLSERSIRTYDGLRFSQQALPEGLAQLNDIFWFDDQSILLGTKTGLFMVRFSESGEMFPSRWRDSEILELLEGNGGIWVVQPDKIEFVEFEEKQSQKFISPTDIGLDSLSMAFPTGKKSELVLVDIHGDVAIWRDGEEGFPLGIEGKSLKAVREGTLGDLWFADRESGVYVLNREGQILIELSLDNGLPSGSMETLHFSPNGQLWLGTSNAGLVRYQGQLLQSQRLNEGRHFLMNDYRGGTWLLASTGELRSLAPDGPAKRITFPNSNPLLQAAAFDGFGNFWLSLADSALFSIALDTLQDLYGDPGAEVLAIDKHGTFITPGKINLGSGDTQVGLPVRDFIREASGRIAFLDSKQRLFNYTVGSFQFLKPAFGFQALHQLPRFEQIEIDGAGNYWLMSQGQLLLKTGEQPIRYYYIAGVSGLYSLVDNVALAGTSNGEIFLCRALREEVSRLSLDRSLFSGPVYGIYGSESEVWIFVGAKLIKAAINLETGELSQVRVLTSQGERLPGPDKDFQFEIDGHGNGWLLYENRLTTFQTGLATAGEIPPMPFFNRIEVGYVELSSGAYADMTNPWYTQENALKLSPGENDISFHFGISRVHSNQPVYYQWRLNNPEGDWKELSSDPVINFSNLSPGDYTLEVRACFGKASCNENTRKFAFRVQPLWWQRTSVKLGSTGLILMTAFFLGRNSMRRRNRRLLEASQKIELEHKILTLQQKSLQLQMNPHFLFNVLQTLRSRINDQKLSEAHAGITHFSRLIRQVLEHSRREEVSLQEEIDLLRNYVETEKMIISENFDFDLVVSEELDSDALVIPSMIIQPFLENAIKHGLKDSLRRQIYLQIEEAGDYIEVLIRDFGPGLTSEKEKEFNSLALKIIRERFAIMGKGGFTIVNASDTDQADSGVIVNIQLPFHEIAFKPAAREFKKN